MKRIFWSIGVLGWLLFWAGPCLAADTLPSADSVVMQADSAAPLADSAATAAAATAAALAAAPAPATPAPENGFHRIIEGTPFTMMGLLLACLFVITALGTALLLLLERNIERRREAVRSEGNADLEEDLGDRLATTRIVRKLFLIGMLVFMAGFYTYQEIKGSPWEGHVNEWMNLIIRWAHVTFGVAWIGASFYFIFLENALYRGPGIREGLAGNLWAIHGGGFYYVEKYKVAPEQLPKHLHWFKWEAYITWISGISLLFVVYYFNASSLMVDKAVADITPGTAILIGLGALVASWFVYDILCRTPLVESKPVFFFVMLGYIGVLAFFLSQWLSPRAAYIHVGAVIGTMMAGNVWRVIIPSQRAMVRAAERNKPVNPELGRHAGLRSLHNNYFTLPVLFIMISNHFPSTFGNGLNWAVLLALTLLSAAVKHYFNLKDQGVKNHFIIPLASLGILGVFFFTAPSNKAAEENGKAEQVKFYQVYQVMTRRCAPCHSAHPIDDVNVVAPNGIMFDTPSQIQAQKDRIFVRAVVTKTMPQNNKTEMTEAERKLIGTWINQGASIDF